MKPRHLKPLPGNIADFPTEVTSKDMVPILSRAVSGETGVRLKVA